MLRGSHDALLAWVRQFGLLMLLYIATTALCAWAAVMIVLIRTGKRAGKAHAIAKIERGQPRKSGERS